MKMQTVIETLNSKASELIIYKMRAWSRASATLNYFERVNETLTLPKCTAVRIDTARKIKAMIESGELQALQIVDYRSMTILRAK